jgi:predicted ATPase
VRSPPSPAALPRQQTLAATVDWSYNLLSAPERVIFDRLAVFAGGFTLDAAEAVASDPAEATQVPAAIDVLDPLTRLVDKSLVVADLEPVGLERYHLLETLRQYAHERLTARDELEEMSHRHAVYCLDQAEEAARHIHGHDQVRWLDRLDRDQANLQTALRWTIERSRVDLGMRLTASLGGSGISVVITAKAAPSARRCWRCRCGPLLRPYDRRYSRAAGCSRCSRETMARHAPSWKKACHSRAEWETRACLHPR